jgi:ribosome biogenesis GTPase
MTARKENITPFIVVNKCDLLTSSAFVDGLKQTFLEQVPILVVSAKGRVGIDALLAHVKQLGRCVFVGVSGVGKSSLLNTIAGSALQKTGATVDKDRHGAHTTSQSVLFTLENGGELIDSPGLRDFSPPELAPNEIAHYFVGFAKHLVEQCHFSNCLHVSEPGCVIKAAVLSGVITKERYENYLELLTASQQNLDQRR